MATCLSDNDQPFIFFDERCPGTNENTFRKEVSGTFQNRATDDDIEILSSTSCKDKDESSLGDTTLEINFLELVELPEGKDKHFFVSYSSEDGQRVFSYVEELERRFNLSCVYADRDFQPGKDISENIKEGMARSLKVLLFLSPKFHSSPWCKFEREFAFVTSIENRTSYIIPVMLEKCEIPATLVPLTYVDASRSDIDVPKRIATTLMQTFFDGGVLPDDLNQALSNCENGCEYIMPAVRDPNICKLRPAKYKFVLLTEHCNILERSQIKVPQELLQISIDVVNKSSVMLSYDFLKRCHLLLWSVMSMPIAILIGALWESTVIITTATRDRLTNEQSAHIEFNYDCILIIFLPIWTGLLIIFVIFLPCCCNNPKRERSLQRKLWNLYADEFINNNVLVIFSERKNKQPVLHIMRYDMVRCKDYMAWFIKDRYPDKNDTEAEQLADILIKDYVRKILPALADDFDSLPEATYNRHNVKRGKMCLCQYVEHLVLHPRP